MKKIMMMFMMLCFSQIVFSQFNAEQTTALKRFANKQIKFDAYSDSLLEATPATDSIRTAWSVLYADSAISARRSAWETVRPTLDSLDKIIWRAKKFFSKNQ